MGTGGRRNLGLAAAIIVVLAATGGGYWWMSSRIRSSQAGATPVAVGPVPVQVLQMRPAPIRNVVTYSGAIQASRQVNIAPRAAGQIQTLRVDVGSVVKAGDVLAQVDPTTLPAQVQQAQAALLSAQARLDLVLAGAKPVDVTAAQASLDSAQTALNQLLNPTATDVTAAESAVATAQSAASNTETAVGGSQATLLGHISTICTSWGGFGLPCGNIVIPLSSAITDAVANTLTTHIGTIGSTPATNAAAVLQSNASYITALNNIVSARQVLLAAQARRDALRSPAPAAVAAQRSTVEQARSTLATRQAPYTDADAESARAAVAQAQAQLTIAQTNFAQTTVTAPFNGIVAQKLLDVGATVTTQTPIFVLISQTLESHLMVDEARIGQIRTGMDAELTVPAFPGKTFRAKVANTAPLGDARAHTFDVKVLVEDPDGQLKAGMFAQLGIILAQRTDAIQLPVAAIVQQGQNSRVFAVVDGKAVARTVRLGVTDGANTEILDGVAAGDSIVVFGQNTLRDGQAVLIATPPTGPGGGAPGGPRPQGSGTPGPAGVPGGAPGGASGVGGAPRSQPSTTPAP